MKYTPFVFSLLTAVVNASLRASTEEERTRGLLFGGFFGTPTTSCSCRSNFDCSRSIFCPNTTCVFSSRFSFFGQCKQVSLPAKPPTRAPTKAPTKAPIKPPTKAPIKPPTKALTLPPSRQPVGGPTQQCCVNPRNIPTECEVRLLIDIMETAVGVNFALLAQWLRLSFHDAGTFNQIKNVGGANGCLLNHPPMRTMGENQNLDLALNTLAVVKSTWEENPDTCLNVSAADLIQFAGLFAVIRQKDIPGLSATKKNELVAIMVWGRPDEQRCQTAWTANLPGFHLNTDPFNIPARCKFAGKEIKDKMMNRNGFTAIEATVLIGAHSIGLTRNVFGTGGPLVSKWSHNGHDNATPQGAKFGNGFHQYLEFDIVEEDAFAFAGNIAPFDTVFPDWFRDSSTGIGHLDTDIALAFPSVDTNVHPHFHTFTEMFANDNAVFMSEFMKAFRKMSALGVAVSLVVPLSCAEGCDSTIKTPTLLTVQEKNTVKADIGVAVAEASDQLSQTTENNIDAIEVQTTVILDTSK